VTCFQPPIAVRSADATDIACWRCGDGPPLVLVHGSGEDHERWRPLAGRLAARFSVWAIDRRGHGRSGRGATHSLRAEARDIDAVVRRIGSPAHLLGHSYGALCCLEAASGGTPVASLTLHEPPVQLDAGPGSAAAARSLALLRAGDREAVVGHFLREVVGAPPAYVAMVRSMPTFSRLLASADALPRELAAIERYRLDVERLRRLTVPTLLLLGSSDCPAFLSAATAALHEAIGGSHVVLLPGRAHRAMDTALDAFVATLADFLRDAG